MKPYCSQGQQNASGARNMRPADDEQNRSWESAGRSAGVLRALSRAFRLGGMRNVNRFQHLGMKTVNWRYAEWKNQALAGGGKSPEPWDRFATRCG